MPRKFLSAAALSTRRKPHQVFPPVGVSRRASHELVDHPAGLVFGLAAGVPVAHFAIVVAADQVPAVPVLWRRSPRESRSDREPFTEITDIET
jgi:hypothetical protein